MFGGAGSGLRLTAINKAFGSQEVLKNINLELASGQVHALLGPNGAGKSTLLGCLSGAIRPDTGTITTGGKSYDSLTPTLAFEAGISIIYQHFQLIGSLSSSDNIFLGAEIGNRFGAIQFAQQDRQTREIFRSLGVDIDPRTLTEDLSVGEQQIVEIARALHKKPSLLILDEPTAALSDHEITHLLALVRRLTLEMGLTVIYVTHLLSEVMQVADSVTVLRDGQILWTRDRANLAMDDIIAAISPDSLSMSRRTEGPPADIRFRISGLVSDPVGPIDLDLCDGEIVGIYGVLGSGRTEMLEALAGARRHTGTLHMDGSACDLSGPESAIQSGVALVASDRKEQSLFGDLSASDNLLMPHFGTLSRIFRRPTAERAAFSTVGRKVGLVPMDPHRDADKFSGGNAQKIAIGRWLLSESSCRLLLMDEPTQGVDIGARRDLYRLLRDFVKTEGRAILFATSDPEELTALADRVAVMIDGRIVSIVSPDTSEEEIIAIAHGHVGLEPAFPK